MFDSGLRSASAAAVVAAIEDLAREEARVAARRVAAISELVRRRCGEDERAYWACDPWDATAAEVGAALGISRGRASGEMHLGLSLRYRLPRVADLFLDGLLSYRVCEAIASRTDLIQDSAALDVIDSAIAEHARSWGVLSAYKLERQSMPGSTESTRALCTRPAPGPVTATSSSVPATTRRAPRPREAGSMRRMPPSWTVG
jgi:Domain of unknown function (DUF222)